MGKKPRFEHGSIVWHPNLPEPGGKKMAGPHYALVVSQQDEIDAGKDLLVVGISSQYDRPLNHDGWFEIPYTPGRADPITGLSKASVAKATWPLKLPQSEFKKTGRAPIKVVKQVKAWLDLKLAEARQAAQAAKQAAAPAANQ